MMKPEELTAKQRMLQRMGVNLKALDGFTIQNPKLQGESIAKLAKTLGDSKLLEQELVQDNRLYIEGVLTQDATWLREYYDEMAVSAMDVRKALSKMTGDIEVWVNSPGGEIPEASSMAVELRTYAEKGNSVLCVVTGRAASAATYILLTSDKVAMFESATLFIHEPWTCGCGTADDMRTIADQLDTQKTQVATLYAKKSGKSENEMLQIMKGDTQLSSKESLEMGFIDEIRDLVVPTNKDGNDDSKDTNMKDPAKQLLQQGMAFNFLLGASQASMAKQ